MALLFFVHGLREDGFIQSQLVSTDVLKSYCVTILQDPADADFANI